MNVKLVSYIENLITLYNTIPDLRKSILNEIASDIAKELSESGIINLVFICTHNSRRSHISQLFTQAAAHYYNLSGIKCFSGGTEATAVSIGVVKALSTIGFNIKQLDNSGNPRYLVSYSDDADPIITFSKKYDATTNPQHGFFAMMVCSDADKNCPFIPSCKKRFSIPFEDPKAAENTIQEDKVYKIRVKEMATEMFYMIKQVKSPSGT